MIRRFLLLVVLSYSLINISAQELKRAWDLQVKPIGKETLKLTYEEQRSFFGHSSAPWQQTSLYHKGQLFINRSGYLQQDTVLGRAAKTHTSTFFDSRAHRSSHLEGQSQKQEAFEMIKVLEFAKYSPVPLLDYFIDRKKEYRKWSDDNFVVYNLVSKSAHIRIFINKESMLLEKAIVKRSDAMTGDYETIINYDYNNTYRSASQAENIYISKYDGKINDTVWIVSTDREKSFPQHDLSENSITERVAEEVAGNNVIVERYNDRLHLVIFEEEESKCLLVEFDDFFVAIEAPLSSENGEAIIDAAGKIAPGKPIRYFMFSHHHPHYMGGVRAFVHNQSTIITTMDNFDYISHITKNKRTISPDILSKEPQMLKLEIIDKQKTIADDNYEMQAYVIGNQSAHTDDYTIFYFPAEKMIFQGDLMWIKNNRPTEKAHPRQQGLYKAIKALNLDVQNIIQSWIPAEYNLKPIVSFSELEQSVFMEK